MSELEYNFDLYITPNIFAPPVLNLSQYDNTRTFIAHLKDDKGQPYLLTQGAVISILGRNKYGPFEIDATYDNDTITFTPSGNATLQYGQIYTTIQLIKDEEYLILSTIILNIQKAGIEKNKIPDEGNITIESLSITKNGTYTAPSGSAYSPVVVNVPQSKDGDVVRATWHQCPEAVRNYLAAVEANPYTDTGVAEILNSSGTKVCDVDNGTATIGGAVYTIRYMNRYPISIFNSSGTKMSNITWGSGGTTPGLFTLNGTEYRYRIKTYINDYALSANQANTKPVGYTIDGVTFRDNEPFVAEPFSTASKAGTLTALDHLRWYNTTDAAPDGNIYSRGRNCRDLGGWACDGGTIKYGMLVRSGEINAADKELMVDKIGIKTEINLLPKSSQATAKSVWGIERYANPTDDDFMYSLAYTDQWKLYLTAIFESAAQSRPVLFHCGAGADKTGTLSVMLMGLLGCSYGDIDTDFELTTFSEWSNWRNRSYMAYLSYINAIIKTPLVNGLYAARISSHAFTLNGVTYTIGYLGSVPISVTGGSVIVPVAESKFMLGGVEYVIEYDNASGQELYIVNAAQAFRNHCASFVLSLGISIDEINAFRAACINGTPTSISPTLKTYTITKTLDHVVVDNDQTTIVEKSSYDANVIPASGYIIDSVKVAMGGTDVTSQVFTGNQIVLNHKVTNNLTGCITNNKKTTVPDGGGYVAIITAETDYMLDGATVSITMGGIDVSNYYSDGKIAIPSVTGDLVITVTAVSSGAGYTNLADPTSAYWKNNYRLSISSGGTQASAGRTVTNFIPARMGDTLRVKGMSIIQNLNGQNGKIVFYSAGDTESSKLGGLYGVGGAGNQSNFGGKVVTNGDVQSYVLAYDNDDTQYATSSMQYIRLDGVLLNGYAPEDVVITINEEID